MHMLWFNVAVCAIALVYCIYQTHCRLVERKRRRLHQRVAYMLWVMAERAEAPQASLTSR